MSGFKGFQVPNFTQVPNEYLDYTISAECQLSKTQMRIMNLFFRETFGWQDKFRALVLSVSDMMAILGIAKKNSVVEALNGLVEDEKFLESIEVSKIPKKARGNIEKLISRKLQPKQKLYRLNLADRQNKSWDFAAETHLDVQEMKEKSKLQGGNQKVTSNQTVTTGGNQKVTTSGNQKVTTLAAESLDTLSVEPSLNKGLNKDLNKLKEEEEARALLNNQSFKLLNDLCVTAGFHEEMALEIVSLVNEKQVSNLTEEVIQRALEMVQDELNRNYIKGDVSSWTAVKIQKESQKPNLNVEPKAPKQPADPKKPQPKYGTKKSALNFRTEKEPDWMGDLDAAAAENQRINEEQIAAAKPAAVDQLMAYHRIVNTFKSANDGKRNTLIFNTWLEEESKNLNVGMFDFTGMERAKKENMDQLLGRAGAVV